MFDKVNCQKPRHCIASNIKVKGFIDTLYLASFEQSGNRIYVARSFLAR